MEDLGWETFWDLVHMVCHSYITDYTMIQQFDPTN
jgi:hypothetical protein